MKNESLRSDPEDSAQLEADFGAGTLEERPTTDEEREALDELGVLLSTAADFDLSPAALARGQVELEALLNRKEARPNRAPSRWRLFWPVPALLAGALLVWRLQGERSGEPLPLGPELPTAQSLFLTAELTGAPVSRGDLDRATRIYRQDLLASLETGP